MRVQGDAANPPVLLLHGISRSLEDWSAQFMLLAAKYRVIGLDLPGFGFSERKPEPATLIALADGVAETLDALSEHRPCHVIGNSLGGAVGVQTAGRPPRPGRQPDPGQQRRIRLRSDPAAAHAHRAGPGSVCHKPQHRGLGPA